MSANARAEEKDIMARTLTISHPRARSVLFDLTRLPQIEDAMMIMVSIVFISQRLAALETEC